MSDNVGTCKDKLHMDVEEAQFFSFVLTPPPPPSLHAYQYLYRGGCSS